MNQDQRKFLIKKVEEEYNSQAKSLKETIREKPLMRDYVLGQALNGGLELKSNDVIKEIVIKDAKIKAGSMMKVDDDIGYGRRRRYNRYDDDDDDDDDSEEKEEISFRLIDIFVIPPAYNEEVTKWRARRKEILKNIRLLESTRDSIILKIQIGSSIMLDKIVAQVDALGDLNLFNDRLQLVAGEPVNEMKKLK